MPLGYQATWLFMMTILFGVQTVNHYGWTMSPELLTETVATIIGSAYLWGWLLWKLWLYRKFPKN
jgi:hypothetical protein